MLESRYQAELIKTMGLLLPGSVVIKNDPSYRQGFPDLLVLHGPRWAALEVKRSAREPFQPNQEYYIDMLNDMSFADVIFPQNEEEVLYALQQTLRPNRSARVLKR